MNYSEEFKKLLRETIEGYIGHGNPNAKVLFLGQEPAWNREIPEQQERYLREIATNRSEWSEIVARREGYETIDAYVANHNNAPTYCSPLHPWPLQKFQIRRGSEESGNLTGKEGTATTWYYYQVLTNLIFDKTLSKDAMLTFHRLTFHTDMSDAAYRQHDATKSDSIESMMKRMELLKQPFFQNFPIVIASVGNFPRDTYGDEYFGSVFGVKYIGNQAGDNLPWINVSVREGDNPQILIHCQQVSAPLTNAYFERIAEIVRDFAKKHSIDLNPAE